MAAPSEKPVDVAEVLAEGDLELIGQIRSASNATLVCDAVVGETSVRCVYKPVRGEQPLWDFPDGTLAGREVGSYLVSETLGWSVIPVTLLRDGPFGPGMVQRWIDTPEPSDGLPTRLDVVDLCSPDLVPEGWKVILSAIDARGEDVVLVHADDPRLQRMAVLDVLINNADRKGGHVLEGLDGQVYGVDHGICLHSDDKLRTVLWGWAGDDIPAHLLDDVGGLLDALREQTSPLREKLGGLISAAEIEALAMRAATMLGDPVMPDANRSRPIPWPAF